MRNVRRGHLTGLGILLFLLILVLAVIFGFRVHKVTVIGNSHHSSDEIAEDLMTNFLSGNTLYLLWTYKNGDIPSSAPYLDSLKISMKSPIGVTIRVTEKPLAGYLKEEEYIYFDADGVILEITDKEYPDLPEVTGVSLGEVSLYQKVPTKSSSQLRTILNLLDLLQYYNLEAQEINFGVNSEITVTIRNIDCVFGQDEYMEEKMANLNAVLDSISKDTTGILHLENVTGKYEDITFTPTGTVPEETEAQKSEPEQADDTTLGGTTTDGAAAESIGDEQGEAAQEEIGEESAESPAEEAAGEETASVGIMVFNSYGQLVYNVRVQNGLVVDAYGSEVPGCYLNEDGYVVDAYMNIIDPATGDLMN